MYTQPGADMFASMQQRVGGGFAGGFGFPPQAMPGLGGGFTLPQQPPQQQLRDPFGNPAQLQRPGGFGMPMQQPPQQRLGGFGAGLPQQQPRPNAFGGGFNTGLPQQMPGVFGGGQQQQRPGGFGGGQQKGRDGQQQQGGRGGRDSQQKGRGRGGGGGGGLGGNGMPNFQAKGDSKGKGGKPSQMPIRESPPRPQHPIPQLTGDGAANWSYGMSSKTSAVPPGPPPLGGKGVKGGKPMFGQKGGGGFSDVHSNVFVGNLPEGTNEAVLQAAFAPFGGVQSCFISSKAGRAYGFVKMQTVDAASRAIAALNGQSGWMVKLANRDSGDGEKGGGKGGDASKVAHSNLFVGNLQQGITEAQLENVFKAYGKVTSCAVMEKGEGKTFGFVEFSTVEEASAAAAGLNGQSGLIVKFANNDKIPTNWEDAVPHSNVFVGNLPKGTAEGTLRTAFDKYGQVQSVSIRADDAKDTAFGFVKMATPAAAKRVIDALDGHEGWSVKCAYFDSGGGFGGKGFEKGFFEKGFGKGGKGWWPPGGWVWTNQNEKEKPEPEPHDNLYVKNLPPGLSEEEVTETFSKAGQVTECRILRWDSTFDCAALIRMGSVEEAIKAKEMLDGKVHEKCLCKISVALQQKAGETVADHCHVKGLHCTTTEEQLQACFASVGEVKWCKIFPLRFDPFSMKPPDCTGLVQMSSPEEAQAAVDKLNDTSPAECGAAVSVRFAEVQGERPDAKPNANLYVKGWPIGFPDFLMQSVFQQYGQVVRLRLLENPDPEQPTCAALVLMAREEDATNALKALDRQRISPPVPAMRVKYSGRDQAPSSNLYVTSLPRTISQEELRDTFAKYGEVVRLKLLNQERSSELRALVELSSVEEAETAVRELDNKPPVFNGVTLHVMYASKREGKGEAA